jgi:hypothetical protein
MKSIREQLQTLRPKIATAKEAPKSKAPIGKAGNVDPSDPQAWKAGVKPLSSAHRKRQTLPPQLKPTDRLGKAAGTARVGLSSPRTQSPASCLGGSSPASAVLPVVKRTTRSASLQPPAVKSGEPDRSPDRRGGDAPKTANNSLPASSVDPLGGRLLNLTETTQFKPPEPWLDVGRSLQPPDGGVGRNLAVYVGVDFGTAFTKLAIRFADKVHLVSWEGISGAPNPHFLPGEVSRVADGYIFVGRAPHAVETWSGLKQPFLAGAPSAEALATATAFLAWVLRYARAWLYRNHGPLLRNRKLAWNLAIGCPTDAVQDKGLVHIYQQVTAAAWLVSRSPEGCSMKTAARALEVMKDPTAEAAQLDSLAVVPEFVAQIASYARSAQRQRGLHSLIDIGAGTLDLATFNVERDQTEAHRDHYPILLSAVELLGTHFLMQARSAACGGALRWSDTGLTPNTAALVEQMSAAERLIRAADSRFTDRVCARVRRVIDLTRGKRSPLSDVWQHGLPLFVAGGGATCDLYRQAVLEACRRSSVQPIVMPLGLGEDVAASSLDEPQRHRVTVAYGLTSDAAVLARITASHEIPNLTLGQRVRQRPDRDELYGK